jgi:hypothetical protein
MAQRGLCRKAQSEDSAQMEKSEHDQGLEIMAECDLHIENDKKMLQDIDFQEDWQYRARMGECSGAESRYEGACRQTVWKNSVEFSPKHQTHFFALGGKTHF